MYQDQELVNETFMALAIYFGPWEARVRLLKMGANVDMVMHAYRACISSKK